MTSEITLSSRATQPPRFTMSFSSTPRGARLARRLAGNRLDTWGIAYDSATHDTVTLIVAELAANAVRHGHVPGRDFRLAVTRQATSLRVEVTDTRYEQVPVLAAASPTAHDTRGRGLLLVDALATRWGWHPRAEGPGKTVWAEYELPPVDGG